MKGEGLTLVNGEPAASLNVMDRGLQYGDGIFRTLKADSGQLRWWKDQYQKLSEDCQALGIHCPEEDLLKSEAVRVASNDNVGVVKIVITRGTSARGYKIPELAQSTRIVTGFPGAPSISNQVEVRWCKLKLAHQPRLAGIKHLNRLENVLARSEWNDPDICEGLLQDESGHVIGGTMSNLFMVEQGKLITPDLSGCGVAGVARQRILRAAMRHGRPVQIEHLDRERLLAAEQVLLCNSLIGVWRVGRLETRGWPDNGWADKLKFWLNEDH
ncbi:MAG: aminodeoxychorismate lyase [Hydrogenophilaceae bacterium]|nr:aminodeoxychorismate lyase [Hydrogenophilaceae bacterium]